MVQLLNTKDTDFFFFLNKGEEKASIGPLGRGSLPASKPPGYTQRDVKVGCPPSFRGRENPGYTFHPE